MTSWCIISESNKILYDLNSYSMVEIHGATQELLWFFAIHSVVGTVGIRLVIVLITIIG